MMHLSRWMIFAYMILLAMLSSAPAATPLAKPATTQSMVPALRLQLVAKGLSSPVQVVNDGTDRLFLVEQPGRIRLMLDGRVESKPFLDVTDHVTHQGECGFLGVAFHPEFSKNGLLYVNYTTGKGKTLHTVISEFKALPNAKVVDPATERIILTIPQPYPNHNGGQVAFGPDGMLYIGMGDGGAANDPENRAQNPKELLGKILRIDVNNRSADKPYGIPADNPFVKDSRFRPEIWAWGMRNPWRFSFDRNTGTCFAGDVGQNKFEEVDVITKGGNYGWRLREGLHEFKNEPGETNLIDPIAEYGRDKGMSVTGGLVYRGKKFPVLDGIYFYADYASGRFWGLRYEEGHYRAHNEGKVLANEELRISVDGKPTLNRILPSGFGDDKDGEIYVCDHVHGNVYQIVAE